VPDDEIQDPPDVPTWETDPSIERVDAPVVEPLTLERLEEVLREIWASAPSPLMTLIQTPRRPASESPIFQWVQDELSPAAEPCSEEAQATYDRTVVSGFGEFIRNRPFRRDPAPPPPPDPSVQVFESGWPMGQATRDPAAQAAATRRYSELLERAMVWRTGGGMSDEPTMWEEFKHGPLFTLGLLWRKARRHFSLRSAWPHLKDNRHASREWRWFGLLCLIREGDEWPRWHGMAWRDFYSGRAWTTLWPFNVVVNAIISVYWRTKRGFFDDGEFARRIEIEDLRRQLSNANKADAAFKESRQNACLICDGLPSSAAHVLSLRNEINVAYHAYTPGFPWDSTEVGWDHDAMRELKEK